MYWVSFGCAIIAFGFAGACVWAVWNRRSAGPVPSEHRGPFEHRDPSWRRELRWGLSRGRALPTAVLWWHCAQFALVGAGAATNGVASVVDSWPLTIVAVALIVSGSVAGAVGIRKRSRGSLR